MTLPASGAISASQIRDEFGDSNPVSLSEFYGLGTPTLPASGTISFDDFHGVSAAPTSVTPTMTVGTSVLYTTKGPDPTGRGFDGGADYYSLSGFGSLTSNALHDSLVISSCYWGTTQIMHFGIQGTGRADADSTFSSIEINSNTYTRSARNFYSSSIDGGTMWYWTTGSTPPFNSSGNYVLTVNWV